MNPQDTLIELQAQILKETRSGSRPVAQFMTALLDRRNLTAALDRVEQSEGANTPGVDGLTAAQLKGRATQWLNKLGDELLHETYRPAAVRWVDLPKSSGNGTRRIGILTLKDRVVHAALKQVLEPVLEPKFCPGSFGFRPGRSVAAALAQATRSLSGDSLETLPFHLAAQLDVADCFDTIDHQILLQRLAEHVSDATLLRLVGQLLAAGGSAVRFFWWTRNRGVVQGSSLSPLLCNLHLHPLDEALEVLKRTTQNGVQGLRYADDLLVLARDARLARQAVACVTQTLARLRQTLRSAKSVVRSVFDGVQWLGVDIQPHTNRWTGRIECGYSVPDARVIAMLARISEMTTPPDSRIDADAFDLSRWIVSINDKLREWHQAYAFAENGPEVFRTVDEHTHNRVGELLHSITGERYTELRSHYRARLPRGFTTWQVNGVRLCVLSSLAPRRPVNLIRRPLWQTGRKSQAVSAPATQLKIEN